MGAAPDLLRGVEKRLRSSRGRFYGHRLGELFGRGAINPILLSICLLALIALLWLSMRYLQTLDAGDAGHSQAPRFQPAEQVLAGVQHDSLHPCKDPRPDRVC